MHRDYPDIREICLQKYAIYELQNVQYSGNVHLESINPSHNPRIYTLLVLIGFVYRGTKGVFLCERGRRDVRCVRDLHLGGFYDARD